MAWREITEEDLLTQISGPELESFRTAALADGQADPVQPTIDQVTRQVRGRVAACQRNTLGEGNTIPDELMGEAVALIVMRIMPRAAGVVIDSGGERKAAAEKADETLRDVARCLIAIEQPAVVSTEKVVSQSPKISRPCRQFDPRSVDGI